MTPFDQVFLLAPPSFWIFWAFVFGTVFGSFLNVVIARVPYGLSVVWPPSHCMSCGTGVKPFHNVPVLSWFLLKGRCSSCLAPFSVRYAMVELGFGVACAFAIARHGLSLIALHEMLLVAFCICLTATDLDDWILPHALTWPGIAAALLIATAFGQDFFLRQLFGAAVGYTGLMIFAAVAERIIHREAMGGGDPWLLGMLGAFLGPSALLPIMLLASLQGSVIGGAVLLLNRRSEVDREGGKVPEGPAASPTPDPDAVPKEAPRAETLAPEIAAAPEVDDDHWEPPAGSIPFGPFLALAGLEVHYFENLRLLFPF